MSLAEDIKIYRKSRGHSMADVSQLTGIPADRIYKWERGTRPNDAEDLLKIQSYLRGELEGAPKLNLESVPKSAPDPSPMQILSVLAEAFRDQAAAHKEQAEALKLQADILKSIESKMAQESTQAIINKKLSAVEDKITEALAGIDTIVDQADEILQKFPSLTSKEVSEKRSPLPDVGSKQGESALGAHKRGKSDGGRTRDMGNP